MVLLLVILHALIQEFLPGGVQALLPENSSDNIFFFFLVLNLNYSFTVVYQWFISKKTIIFQGFRGRPTFLAHLSRRLMGELIVYQSLRRPSVHPQFQTSSPLKPLGQSNSNFIWRLLRTRERKFVQMVLVT